MKKRNRAVSAVESRLSLACRAVFICLVLSVVPILSRAEMPFGLKNGSLRIVDYALSPNGNQLAEVAHVRWNKKSSMEIIIRDLNMPKMPAHTMFSGKQLSSVEWLNDRRVAFIASGNVTEIFMEEVKNNRVTQLLETRKRVSRLLPEPNGHLLAYSYVSSNSSVDYKNAASVKVTDSLMILNLVLPKRHPAPYRMTFHAGILHWDSKGASALARRQWRWTWWPPKMAWVNGRLLVLLHGVSGYQSAVVDLQTGKAVNLGIPGNWTYLLASNRHGVAAAVTMSHNIEVGSRRLKVFVRNRTGRVHVVSAGKAALTFGLWLRGAHRLIEQVVRWRSASVDCQEKASFTGLVEINWRNGKLLKKYTWPHGTLGAWPRVCSVDRVGDRAVCISQTLRDPMMLVSINLKSGKMRKLWYLQSGARRLSFKFRKLIVRNRFGEKSSGFLALPKGWSQHEVPLAVMTYGFERQYSRYGQWITSYPVARLVHAGIAVLLLNFPKERPYPKGDFAAALRENVQEPLSTVASAVPAVRRAGVRVKRAMIMGWSQGGLIAAFAIQDLHQFVAAQVGDPQEWTITSFSLGSAAWRRVIERQFGGPPDRRYIKRYLDFDPVSDGRPAHGPILFEFVSRNVPEGQFLQEWRAAGTYVEAFAYRDSDHTLNVPAEAKISRERNLDWAKLNLLGPQSVSSAELHRVGLTIPVNGWWSRGETRRADRR